METNNFITEMFPQNGRKLESLDNITRDIFIQFLAFNKTIIPLTLVGYEFMIIDIGAPHLACYLKAHINAR